MADFPTAAYRLYGNALAPVLEVDFASAELAKMIDNTWRATKVAFANETARLAMASGADSAAVLRVLTTDTRHNLSATYLQPGMPFGGYCLPKDSSGVAEAARVWGMEAPLFAAIADSNDAHAEALAAGILAQFSQGSALLQVGLGFKPGSDDLRASPLLALARRLLKAGVDLTIYDPAFVSSAQWPPDIRHCWCEALNAVDVCAVVLGHPWPEEVAQSYVPVIDLTLPRYTVS